MTEDEDYKKLLDEKFNGVHTSINLQFDGIKNQLNNIEKQTTRTNGRVNKLEESVIELQLSNAKHVYNCPQNNRFDKLEKALEDYKTENNKNLTEYSFVKKYPKISIGIIVVSVLIILFSYVGVNTLLNNTQQINTNTKDISAIEQIESQNKKMDTILENK